MKAILVIILCSCFTVNAQIIFSGRITDSFDNEPIRDLFILNQKTGKKLDTTDRKGEFAFTYNFKVGDVLILDHVGFVNRSITITKRMIRNAVKDTVYLNYQMDYKTLAPLRIKDPSIPDTAYGSEEHSISDYEFHEGKYVFLAYDQTLRKGSKVMLVDENQKELSTYYVPERATELLKDYTGTINVICKNSVYEVVIFGNDISLIERDKELFDKYVAPVVDTLGNFFYYSNFNRDYPAFEYYAYNVEDSSHTELLKVEDELIMELYLAEYKYVDGAEKVWAKNKENETGIDKEIWIGLKYFTNNLYYKPLYAPMFLVDNEVVVMDHYANRVMIFDENHVLIDSLPIFYHLLKGKQKWAKQVIQDQENDRIYALMKQDGYKILVEIDLETGRMEEAHKFFYKYTENVQVKGDEIFYIYRPFESAQKKFLYKEKIQF